MAYNAELDQIMVTSRLISEFWIIDHSTTTAEAAGHTGGKQRQGRRPALPLGQSAAYRAGTAKDQPLFDQHNAHWIPKGLPGEGHVLVFNNGTRGPSGNHSVGRRNRAARRSGRAATPREPGKAYGPAGPVWSYSPQRRPTSTPGSSPGATGCPTATRSSVRA